MLPEPDRVGGQRRYDPEVLGKLGFIGVALLERTKAVKGWLEVAMECGCATAAECGLFPAPGEGPVDPELAPRVIRVQGQDCRRPPAA